MKLKIKHPNSYPVRVSRPTHRMIEQFMTDELSEAMNTQEIKDKLKKWPQYAKEHGLELHEDWKTMGVVSDQIAMVSNTGPGGPLTVGWIKKL